MFREVSFNELIPGKKYKILNKDRSFYTAVFVGHQGQMQYFDHTVRFASYNSFIIGTCLFMNRKYYEFVSQKDNIQQAMEKRALVKVLAHIGVHHFDW
jgi:hypothetical protein